MSKRSIFMIPNNKGKMPRLQPWKVLPPRGFASLRESHLRILLPDAYERAGFRMTSIETIRQADLRSYVTKWATRLGLGRSREISPPHERSFALARSNGSNI